MNQRCPQCNEPMKLGFHKRKQALIFYCRGCKIGSRVPRFNPKTDNIKIIEDPHDQNPGNIILP